MIEIRIPSGDWSLAATLSGEHPRLVFLHPGVADRRCWCDVMSALVPDFPAVAYDRRGFGETPAADAPFVDVDDLRAVLDACVAGPAVLVGNSQGGRIAIDFALAHPERVDRLALIAPAVSGAPEPDWVAEIGQSLEALIWLDGPAGPEGRVGGTMRDLFLAMNLVALKNESAPQSTPMGRRVGPVR